MVGVIETLVTYRPTILGLIFLTLSLTFSSVLAQDEHTIFFDNFEDGDLVGWDISFAGNDVEVINLDGNNVLHITGEQNDFVSLGFSDDLNGAAVIETRIQIIDLGPNNGSVVLNLMSENPGHASGYSALVSSGGASLLNRNDNFTDIEPVTQQDFQINLGQWYLVRFEASSSTLNLWVDGVSVKLASVDVLETGEPVLIFDRGMEVYLDDVRIEHPDYVALATETPQLVTATPEPSPIPYHYQEVSTEAPIFDNTNLVTGNELRDFPNLISYQYRSENIVVRLNNENLSQMGVPLGVFECNDHPLTQEAFGDFREYQNDLPLEVRCVSGIVTRIHGEGLNPSVQMMIPLPETRGYFRVNLSMGATGALFLAAENGTVVPPLPSTMSNIGRITYGPDQSSMIAYNNDLDTITIPTTQGISTLRVGDQLVARVVLTEEVYTEANRDIFRRNSGGLSPTEVIEAIYDGNPNNNPDQWTIPSFAFLMNFNPE